METCAPVAAEHCGQPAGQHRLRPTIPETVLGEHSINWGNVIVVVMILGLVFGGGAFVYWNERRRGV